MTRGAGGQLAIQPATLAQVVAEPKLLRRLDAGPSHKYGVEASDLKHVAALLEASPDYLSRRMKLLESRLAGEQRMVLTTAPSEHAERWKAAKHVAARGSGCCLSRRSTGDRTSTGTRCMAGWPRCCRSAGCTKSA